MPNDLKLKAGKPQETKAIKCSHCGKHLDVPKWAPKVQSCAQCSSNNSEVLQSEELQLRPVDKLKSAQDLLNNLGFNITSRGYSKQYHDGSAVIRIEPHWDSGTSMAADYVLVGIMVTRQELVTVSDKDMNDKIPPVAHSDIATLLQGLNIQSPSGLNHQTHIDTIKCTRCGDRTAEWTQIGNDFLCITKCSPIRRPYGQQ